MRLESIEHTRFDDSCRGSNEADVVVFHFNIKCAAAARCVIVRAFSFAFIPIQLARLATFDSTELFSSTSSVFLTNKSHK